MSELGRERDLVLNPNEYAYVLDKTKGLISCVVGSYKMSLSTSDSLVVFNEKTKRFEEAGFTDAITTFVTAPENWYVTLKNPAKDDKHPASGTANPLPDLEIGKKVNIRGNISFALYPGQMAKAIQGHRLHSNQYLLARVYDVEALEKADKMEGEATDTGLSKNKYTNGQLLVIKGTEVSFYIPPTGIEVVPIDGRGGDYVRDAVTLEKLEYCILKNEQGDKKYIHGAAVVFPEPDEIFVENSEGGYKFKAVELSDISGVYVKVISDYTDESNGKQYKAGEELFITGKDQMIYYPRPEHAIIDYNGKIIHQAVAIPLGEGRYVLDRNTGNIKTVKGATMYLPDPRKEIMVNRKLTRKQCELWYPGNEDVLKYNLALKESDTYSATEDISIDSRFDGVVSIDIWTGYAVNVVSRNGNRKVVTGAQTYLLEYDETLELLELSTGRPKTTDNLLKTVYLRVDNNKISDLIKVQTKDFVDVQIKVSYCVDFLPEYEDKWFNVENYVKYLTDRERSLLKREAKKHTIEEFYESATDIVRKVVLNISDRDEKNKETECARSGRFFKENGMLVHDVEVLSVYVQKDIEEIINKHQQSIIEKSLELSNANKEIEVITKLAELEKLRADIEYSNKIYKIELENKISKERIEEQEAIHRIEEEAVVAAKTAEKNIQTLMDSIQKSELDRMKEKNDAQLIYKKEADSLEILKQKAYMDAVKSVIESISPDLIASMNSSSNAQLMQSVAESISPYAMANGESISDVTNRLLRGTSLEGILGKMTEVL